MEFAYGHGDRPLPGYTIMRAVGRGAFGEVYFAVSDGGREVALKRLVDNADIEIRGVKRVINIKNPHLISVFDIMTGDDGRPYIVMEYVAGPSLRDILNEHPQGLGEERIRYFFRGISSALACLHAQSIVHRDLKPENIFLDEGYIKIGDYGLAKHISVSQAGRQTINLGTVHYMAPEIATGIYDHRVDIYALGVLLYEMFTGQVPFMGSDIYEIALKHVSSEVDVRKIPRKFRGVVAKAMAKDPKERHESVQELAADLGIAVTTAAEPVDMPAPPAATGPQKKSAVAAARAGTAPPRSAEPPHGKRRGRITIFSGEGWLGRIGMALVAAMAMSLALALAPPDMGLSIKSLLRTEGPTVPASPAGTIGGELLPMFCALGLGCLFVASISLWFLSHGRAYASSSMACRLMASSVFTIVCGAIFLAGPYVVVSPGFAYVDFDLGLARLLSEFRFRQLLFIVFVGVMLVNWLKVANPERKARVSLTHAVGAGVFGWIVSLFFQFPSLTPAGLLAGLALCVNFVAPTAEDLGEAPTHAGAKKEKVYLERRWHARRGTTAAASRATAQKQGRERQGQAPERRRGHRGRFWWLWWVIGALILWYIFAAR